MQFKLSVLQTPFDDISWSGLEAGNIYNVDRYNSEDWSSLYESIKFKGLNNQGAIECIQWGDEILVSEGCHRIRIAKEIFPSNYIIDVSLKSKDNTDLWRRYCKLTDQKSMYEKKYLNPKYDKRKDKSNAKAFAKRI